jgi:hypothetical protein
MAAMPVRRKIIGPDCDKIGWVSLLLLTSPIRMNFGYTSLHLLADVALSP